MLFWSICLFFFLAGIISPITQVNAAPISEMVCSSITAVPSTHDKHGTGEKPQSKVWTTPDGEWWSVFPTTSSGASSAGSWLWQLQQNDPPTWSPILKLSDETNTKADIKVDGSVAHILLYVPGDSELVSVEYTGSTYQLWSSRPAASEINLNGSEVATIDIDSTDRMWLATETSNQIIVYYSDPPYDTWSSSITVSDSNTSSDDIGVVTAMPNNKIGVFWSNQGNDQFLFRIHNDEDDPNTWQDVEEAAANNGIADDHVNVAVASDGTLYAAVKTSGAGSMKMLVRRPDGTWDDDYDVDTSQGTRPIVQLNEASNVVTFLFPTSSGTGGDIVYRESPADVINFGPTLTLADGPHNDPSSTKDNFTNELVVLFYYRGDDTVHGKFCKTPGPIVDLSVTKTDAADPVVVGSDITYTIDVVNNGPETAENVTVTDTLPSTVNFQSANPDSGSCNHDSGTITCDVGDLDDDESTSITVVVTTTQPGTLTNNVSVSSDGVDSNSGNNSTSEDTTVNNTPPSNAEVGITKTDLEDPIDLGENINYSVVVVNNGPQTAKSVVVTDTLPENVDFVTAVPDNGSSCSHDSGTITCNLGDLADQATVTIPIVVTPTTGGTFTNNVSVTGNITDGDSSNDSDSEDTTVESSLVNMTLSPVHDAYVSGGSSRTFGVEDERRLRLRNDDGSSARNTYIKFEIPPEVASAQSAILRLHVNDDSNGEHSIYAVSSNYADDSGPWLETLISDDNAPPINGVPLATIPAGSRNEWEEFDVTSAISGGTVSFAITSTGGTHYYDSDEATDSAKRPHLVLVANVASEDEPDIAVSPASMSKGQAPDSQTTETMTISNDGEADLNWSIMEDETAVCSTTDDIAWASLSNASGTITPANNDTVDVTFDATGLSDGTYTGDLCVQSDDPNTPLVQVSLTLEVCTPPSPLTITDITVDGTTNTVSWVGTATHQFEVWWGANDPYFSLGEDCSTADNCAIVANDQTSYDHDVADSMDNYTYILIADNVCGPNVVSSGNSNIQGEFTFGVIPGS
ncbi:MAG: hypothetical protein AAF614_17245 [Chloroflexota bacterium]